MANSFAGKTCFEHIAGPKKWPISFCAKKAYRKADFLALPLDLRETNASKLDILNHEIYIYMHVYSYI